MVGANTMQTIYKVKSKKCSTTDRLKRKVEFRLLKTTKVNKDFFSQLIKIMKLKNNLIRHMIKFTGAQSENISKGPQSNQVGKRGPLV